MEPCESAARGTSAGDGSPRPRGDEEKVSFVAGRGEPPAQGAAQTVRTSGRWGCTSCRRWVPVMLIACSSMGFSIQALLARKLTLSGVPAFQVISIRGFCQILGCLTALRAAGQPCATWFGPSRLAVRMLIFRAFVGFFGMGFGFLAVSMLPIAETAIMFQTSPMFAAIFAWAFLSEPWHLTECIGTVASIVGVAFIVLPASLLPTEETGQATAGVNRSLGSTIALLGSIASGGAYVIVRYLGTRVQVSWATVMLYQAIGQGSMGLVCLHIVGEHLLGLEPWQIAASLLVGFVGFVDQVCMTYGMQREKAAVSSVVREGFSPVFSMLMQALFLPSDPFLWTALVGFGIILAGFLLVVAGKAQREARQGAPDEGPGAGSAEPRASHAPLEASREPGQSSIGRSGHKRHPQREESAELAKTEGGVEDDAERAGCVDFAAPAAAVLEIKV